LWILNPVENEEEGSRPFLLPVREKLSETSIWNFLDDPYHILMGATFHHLFKGFSGCKRYRDFSFLGPIEDGLKGGMKFLGAN
jgi:hypothetical protein